MNPPGRKRNVAAAMRDLMLATMAKQLQALCPPAIQSDVLASSAQERTLVCNASSVFVWLAGSK